MPKRTKNDLLSNSEKTIVLEYKLRTGYYKKIIETDVKHTQHLSFYLSQHIITWLFKSTYYHMTIYVNILSHDYLCQHLYFKFFLHFVNLKLYITTPQNPGVNLGTLKV